MTLQLMLAISRVPRYALRLDSTIFIRAYAEDAGRIEARVKMVHMAVFEVSCEFPLIDV